MTVLMSTIALLFFFLPSFVFGVQYRLFSDVVGKDFYDFFSFETFSDPTHGRVQYVDQGTAQKFNLTFASKNAFILRVDSTEVLDPSGPGRKSVRIHSKDTFTQHVAVFNIRHIPVGCGSWPALWEVTDSAWPVGGEIDIIEGVNSQSPNAATLHTTEGCTMPRNRANTGNEVSFNCASSGSNNQGCGVQFSEDSYGPPFNKKGGGWYAIERTNKYIKIFFWSRTDGSVPSEVKSGAPSVNPSNWGTPVAFFPSTSCDISKYFDAHRIIINITLCGDWAGATYSSSGCPSTCIDHVNNDPKSFRAAYFNIASMRVYQQ